MGRGTERGSLSFLIYMYIYVQVFRAHSTKQRLLEEFGAEVITVATANTHSYHKGMTSCLLLHVKLRCVVYVCSEDDIM